MRLFSTLKFILNHPLNKGNFFKVFFRFISWQINVRLNPYPIVYSFTTKSKLIVCRGRTGATGNLYCGLHEFQDMGFLLHFLREEDKFIDVGANIGSYTILAAAHVGTATFSIEPVPATYNRLLENIFINGVQQKVTALNVAAGSKKGQIRFTSAYDTVNHVAISEESGTIDVRVEVLDDLLKDIMNPTLLKIDVEGFETEVIKGGFQILNSPNLKALIVELNGSGKRYGFDEAWIHSKLMELGYAQFSYDPLTRSLVKLNFNSSHNAIYIKDESFVRERISKADKILLFEKIF